MSKMIESNRIPLMRNLLLVLALCSCVYAMTDTEAKKQLLKFILSCTKEHPVDMSELILLQQHVVPTKPEVKCLLACAYKHIGTLDKKGVFNVTKGYKIAEMMREGDDKRVENGKKLADICAKVNDHPDNEEGCERAGLIFKCTIEHAPKLGFNIDMINM